MESIFKKKEKITLTHLSFKHDLDIESAKNTPSDVRYFLTVSYRACCMSSYTKASRITVERSHLTAC